MSVILKALKSQERESNNISKSPLIIPEGEGFFKGRQSMVKKDPYVSKKRIYVLSVLFAAAVIFAVALQWVKNRPAEPESAKQPAVAHAVENSNQTALAVQAETSEAVPADIVERANAAFAGGDYETAVKLFKEAIAKDQNNAMLHNNLGLIFVKKELYSSAEDEYKKALESDDKCAECFNNFGYLKSILGESFEARKYFEKASALLASYADPYFNLAVLSEKEGDIGNAVKYYRQFIELYPNKSDTLYSKVNKRVIELAGK
ncbi:MAG: tetratricopeptide repeat protein [Deltaproteobacteria bacterium]|nr:tetratricopeptide repeat protein [Deltaproteobacteria bacterium]